MLLILPAVIIALIALVLEHKRKDRFAQDYMKFLSMRQEAGDTSDDKRLLLFEEYLMRNSHRKGLFATVLGLALLVIPFVGRFILFPFVHAVGRVPPGSGMPALFPIAAIGGMADILYIAGMLVLAYGVANLVIWFFVDKPRLDR